MNKKTALVALCLLASIKVALSALMFHETLGIGGTELITLRGPTQEGVHERADVLYLRLNAILSDSTLESEDIQVRKIPSGTAIFAKERLFVTVTPRDGAYNQTTCEKQAQAWCKRLAETLPTLKSAERPPV